LHREAARGCKEEGRLETRNSDITVGNSLLQPPEKRIGPRGLALVFYFAMGDGAVSSFLVSTYHILSAPSPW